MHTHKGIAYIVPRRAVSKFEGQIPEEAARAAEQAACAAFRTDAFVHYYLEDEQHAGAVTGEQQNVPGYHHKLYAAL